MKKIFLTTSILILALNISVAYASESTDAGSTPTPTPDTEVTTNIKERLKNTIKTAKQNLINTNEKQELKAFVGTVKDIIQNTINITTKDDDKYASINDDTVIIRSPGNRNIKAKDIQIEDFIIAIGYPNKNEEMDMVDAKRIIVSQKLTLNLSKKSGMGKITNITKSSITITDKDGNETEIKINKETIVKNKDEVLSMKDLEQDNTIIYTATTKKDTVTATIIMIVE